MRHSKMKVLPMFRITALPALALLAACQMTTQPQITTREDRIAVGLDVISACARTQCRRLNLDSQLIEDYAIITPLTHVTAFMASYSDFNDLAAISAMIQLRELHIGATQIDDLDGVSNFPDLTLLHAQQLNNVSDFSPVAQLTSLTELAIGGNDLGDMAFLRGMANLTDLNLDYAEIDSLDVLRRLPKLERLDLNEVTLPEDISTLLHIQNLKAVSVSEWFLTDTQIIVLDDLRARGVDVQIENAVIVC